ncbi:hypothetical protein SAMN03159417_00515 [Ralstonia sp. NFACC01]|nr:hypothetical protein SAMN03159417_00515 [Ralstonia sp. NFACC01]
MKALAESIFPWSVASLDSEFYEQYYEENGDDDCTSSMYSKYEYKSAGSRFETICPYTNESGEVDRYRLKLKLGKLGKAYLLMANYAKNSDN